MAIKDIKTIRQTDTQKDKQYYKKHNMKTKTKHHESNQNTDNNVSLMLTIWQVLINKCCQSAHLIGI